MNDILPTLFDSELPQEQSEQVIFDYRLLSADKREFVLQKTDETQWLLKKTAENIVKIGKNLLEVKETLPYGDFGDWLRSEFSMSSTTAQNFMQVANRFEGRFTNFVNLSSSVLYLLAAPSTPESAVNQALELADKGKKVTHAMAQKLIEAEKAREKAETEKAEALAETEIAQQKLFAVKTETETKITELSEQIAALQAEMTTLTTPATEYVDKEVWPEDKVKELEDLQGKLDELNTKLEDEKKAIPSETQKELDELKRQLTKLNEKKKEQEEVSKSQQERIDRLNNELRAAVRDSIASENDERIRQDWRTITSESRSCMMRLLGQWPTPLDIRSFESDDWERLSQLKSTLKRVLEECDALSYGSDHVSDSVDEPPIAFIESRHVEQDGNPPDIFSYHSGPVIGIPPEYQALFDEYKQIILNCPEDELVIGQILWSAPNHGYTNQFLEREKHIQFTKELLSSEVNRRIQAAIEAMKWTLGTWEEQDHAH